MDWPLASVFMVVIVSLFTAICVMETGRYPWDRKVKTITLTKAEAKAWAAGERVMWRKLQPQPDILAIYPFSNCPYGKPGDTVGLRESGMPETEHPTIAAIRVTKRGGVWGWEMKLEGDGNG